MYHLAKGWDIESDEGKEQEGNFFLVVKANINPDGSLDFDSISVFADIDWSRDTDDLVPIEEFNSQQPNKAKALTKLKH